MVLLNGGAGSRTRDPCEVLELCLHIMRFEVAQQLCEYWNILTTNGKHCRVWPFFHTILILGLNFSIRNEIQMKI